MKKDFDIELRRIFDSTILCLEEYYKLLDNREYTQKELILSFHVFSAKLLPLISQSDQIISEISSSINSLDDMFQYDEINLLTPRLDICVSMRREAELLLEKGELIVKAQDNSSRNKLKELINGFIRKIFLVKKDL